MASLQRTARVSRRTALAALGAGGVVFAGSRLGASAQGNDDLAGHPMVGTWLSMVPAAPGVPPVPNPTIFSADGFVVQVAAVSRLNPEGVVTIASSGIGRWESTGERSSHFTVVQVLSNAEGAYLGTITIDGHPRVSDDGQTLIDDSSESYATIRDPGGNIVSTTQDLQARVAQPVMGVRIEVGSAGFPSPTPSAGTPVS